MSAELFDSKDEMIRKSGGAKQKGEAEADTKSNRRSN